MPGFPEVVRWHVAAGKPTSRAAVRVTCHFAKPGEKKNNIQITGTKKPFAFMVLRFVEIFHKGLGGIGLIYLSEQNGVGISGT
jgi:hypothetical protein